jgi:hypothetical protein
MNTDENKLVLDVRKDSRGRYGLLVGNVGKKDESKWVNIRDCKNSLIMEKLD